MVLKDRFFFKLGIAVAFLLLLPSMAQATCGSVVIDPGHGGGDTGAVGPTGFAEKTANLDIGLRVRNLLAKAGYHVIMTRTTDISPNTPPKDLTGDGRINVSDDLQARVDIANRAKAKVFVSIHNNAFGPTARGTETYYWSGASSTGESARLAALIQEEVKAQIGLYDRGVKSANFYVLRRTDMPAALVEGAFISNATEELLLKTPSFRQKIAQGVFNGIRRFVGPTGPGPDEMKLKLRPNARRKVDLNAYFCDKSIGARVTASLPIMAERAMYYDSSGIRDGSNSPGVRGPGRVWYFAEGFTGAGFDTWLLLANPRNTSAVAKIKYHVDGAVVKGGSVKLPPRSRRSVHVNRTLPGRSFAAKVAATDPIVVDRSIYFKSGGLNGGYSSPGVRKPAFSWYFAEGRTGGGFDTWLLLFNPNSRTAKARISYLTPTGEIESTQVEIAGNSRQSIRVNDSIPDSEVGMVVLADRKIVAERSVYFTYNGTTGGHSSMGAVKPTKTWYFANGSTAAGYSIFLAVQNPGTEPAAVVVDYLVGKNEVIKTQKIIPPRSRQTFSVGDAAEAGARTSLAIRLSSDRPVVAEKSAYFNSGSRQGGSGFLGAPRLSKKWLFAEGFTGEGFETQLMLTNPSDRPAEVKIRFFK